MTLMHFLDTFDEIPDGAGPKVHRAYCVATDKIDIIKRQLERIYLLFPVKLDIPVSKSYYKAVSDTGILT
jgi:DNA-binding LytR/AlgR family response regulator